ncbi:CdaR family transcriptional regulator [Azorhizophilus paspali]|uniref:CdaR family transcriptional regulator n=1 Tax=Azorhizophilus paspali TaxID=69963 RepID=A0ABV6SN79_AZOPA
MFELDYGLAQDIVSRAMAILPYNVNVMDSQGLILASGERSRINTRHEGAQLVLANGRVVAIDSQVAACLRGVQPGINLPLFLDRRLIGVLGITGDPEQVRIYAELVRMSAEMLVAQRYQQQVERHWRRQRSDDLLALLLEEGGDILRLFDEAHLLGLKPQLGRTPWLFELAEGVSAERLGDWLLACYPDSWCVSPAASSLLWCRPGAVVHDEARLLERIEGQGWWILRVAVGERAEGVDGVRRGYRRVRDLLAYGRAILADQRLLSLQRHRLPALLWRFRDDEAVDELLRPLRRLRARDAGGQLLRTLRSWCEHGGQNQACADALGVHRNSLRYRMERIAELSGVDPLSLDGLLSLYLGVQLLPEEPPA